MDSGPPGATPAPLWGPVGRSGFEPVDTVRRPPRPHPSASPPPAPPPIAPLPPPQAPADYFTVTPSAAPNLGGSSGIRVPVLVGVAAFVIAVATVLTFALWGNKNAEPAATQPYVPPAVPAAPAAPRQYPSAATTSTIAPTVVTTAPTTEPPVELTPGAVPVGYHLVSGPGGVTTCIPDGWSPRAGAVATNQQADNPARPSDFVRFGGSASPNTSLLNSILAGERTNPNVRNGYHRIRLEQAASAPSADTVDWEFTFVKDGQTRHSYGRYWRVNGIDYVVYASASPETWPAMRDILTVMMRAAAPV